MFSIVMLFVQVQCFAQAVADTAVMRDHYIINTKVYNKGIYKTFDDFKYNRPSIVENYSFEKGKLWLTNVQTGKTKKVKNTDVWGFSDGNKVYVSWHKYNELLELGRYCYFREKGVRIMFGISGAPPMILPFPLPYKDEFIINFNTGKPYLVSKKLLKRIFKTDDPLLLSDFMNETQKRKKFLEYIMRYNERNAAKIK